MNVITDAASAKKTTLIASMPVSPILPDQLAPVIHELSEVSNLAEFLCTSVMRAQDTQEGEFSLSFGESAALISLMQAVADRIANATGKLTDLRFGLGKEDSQQ